MNEPLTELEEAVRERFVRASVDVPEVDTMRIRVLAALEQDNAAIPIRMPSFWARNKRTAGLLLGVAAAIAAVAVLLPEQPSQTVVVAAERPGDVAATVDNAAPSTGLSDDREALAEGPAQEELGTWFERAEAEHVRTYEFVPDQAEPGDPSQYVRIVSLPAATTADEVVETLTASLFDTAVVGDAASRIGGLESRALRLETVGGTTHLGFKVAADTYLETEGIDRVFVVHITAARPETLVIWIEAGSQHIDGFEEIASRLIAALNGG